MTNEKKIILLIGICICTLFASCQKEVVTYEEVRATEQEVINNFMDKHGFKVIKEYPKNGIFKDSEFILLDNGSYLHVTNSGKGKQTALGTEITCIAKGVILYKDSTRSFDGFQPDKEWTKWPIKFKYIDNGGTYNSDKYFLSEGLASALKFVGDSSSVSMIVPFTHGSLYQLSVYMPIYFERIDFIYSK
ncbi:MAG: DUF4827 family protein [Parabacteroides sp.]|nr:DUF4827 family protein [Parabacteroides sp.]